MVLNNRDWWRVHLQRIEAEELTTKAYADREGLDVQSLYYWRKVFRSETSRQPRASRPATSSFVALRLTASSAQAVQHEPVVPCHLTLPSGLRLEMAQLPELQWLVQLGRALQEPR